MCEFGAVSVSFSNLYSAPSKARNPFHLAHDSELDPFSCPPLKHRRLAFVKLAFALRKSLGKGAYNISSKRASGSAN